MEIVGRSFKKGKEEKEQMNMNMKGRRKEESQVVLEKEKEKEKEKERAEREEIMKCLGIGESIKSQDVFIQQVQQKEKSGLNDMQLSTGLIEQVEQRLKRTQLDNLERQQVFQQEQQLSQLQDQRQLLQLHDQPQRVQQLEHVLSTMDRPTIENVESHLQEHRQRMQVIQEKYRQQKGMNDTQESFKRVTIQEPSQTNRQSNVEYQFKESDLMIGDNSNDHFYMEDTIQLLQANYEESLKHPVQPTDHQHLANQIESQHSHDHFINQRRSGQGFKQDDQAFHFSQQQDQGIHYNYSPPHDQIQTIKLQKKNKKKLNPWQDKQIAHKVDPQQIRKEKNEYKQRYHHYKTNGRSKSKESKSNKSINSNHNKSNKSINSNNNRTNKQNKSINSNQKRTNKNNRSISNKDNRSINSKHNKSYQNKSLEKSHNISLNDREDKRIGIDEREDKKLETYNQQQVKRLFNKEDIEKSGFISKNNLIRLLTNNQSLLDTYHLSEESLLKSIWSYPFNHAYKLSLSELLSFLSHHQQHSPKEQANQEQESIQTVFQEVDRHDDLIVDKKTLIKRLLTHPLTKGILDKACRYLPDINRVVSYRKVLVQMSKESASDDREYVSCQQFLQELNEKPIEVVMELDEEGELIVDDENIHEFELVASIQEDKCYEEVMGLVGRQPKDIALYADKQDFIRLETVHQVFQRMINDVYQGGVAAIDYQEILQYFSVIGKPQHIYSFQAQLHNQDVDMHYNQQQFNSITHCDSDNEIQYNNNNNNNNITNNKKNRNNKNRNYKSQNSYSNSNSKTNRSRSKESQNDESHNELFGESQNFQKVKTNYTVPEQFNMMRREGDKAQTIHERKFEEYINEIEEQKDMEINKPFRANEVPDIVKVPLLDQINQEQKQRRQKVKQNCVYITVQNQKPFNFYEKQKEKDNINYLESKMRIQQLEAERDKKKPKKKKENNLQQFQSQQIQQNQNQTFTQTQNQQSKGVQWFVTNHVGEQQNYLDEAQRKERINQRAQEQLAISKLPPRMEKHLKIKEINELRNRTFKEKQKDTYKIRRKSVPDFKKEQIKFQKVMDQKKSNKRVTEIIPFNFEDNKKIQVNQQMDMEDQMERNKMLKKEDPLQRYKRMYQQQSIQEYPQNTKKWDNCMVKTRQRKEREEKLILKKEKEQKAREDKQKRFAPRVQQSEHLIDNTKKLQKKREEGIKEMQQQVKQQTLAYKERVKEMNERVKDRPLLFEQDYSNDKKLLEMKKVYMYVKTLQDGGLSKKRINELLSPQQKEIYEDYEFLSKKGYKDIFLKLDKKQVLQ